MKKQTLSMLMLALAFAGATLVGCKDYDSDIQDLQTQITDNKAAIAELQGAMGKGVTIAKMEKTADGYKLTMSDGKSMEIKNGTNGTNAVAPELRVNDAKNWEMSTDGGATWAELKDATGASIADAKTFVTDYIKINADGYIVIGDKVTSFKYDVKIPSITIDNTGKVVIVTMPGDPMHSATVPMMGYFDQSVASIVPLAGKTVLTLTKTTIAAAQTIGGREYTQNQLVYSSSTMPVVLNPSKVDASNIPFSFVAVTADGAQVLPIELRATAGTSDAISSITTKSAADVSAVWTIKATAVGDLGTMSKAENIALSAMNFNGSSTLSDYAYTLTVAAGSSATGTTTTTVKATASGEATIAAATGIIDSELVPASGNEGLVTIAPKAASTKTADAPYVGDFTVTPLEGMLGEGDSKAVSLTYNYIGADGAFATESITVTFSKPIVAPVATYVVSTPAKLDLSAATTAATIEITKDELFAAMYSATADLNYFKSQAATFALELDKAAPAGTTAKFDLSSSDKGTSVANEEAFDKIKITVPVDGLFKTGSYSATLTFQDKDVEESKFSVTINFSVLAESPVLATKVDPALTIANNATTAELTLAGIKLYTDAEASSELTSNITGQITEITSVNFTSDDVTVAVNEDGSNATFTRVADEAPSDAVSVTYTVTGVDRWGKSFTTQEATLTIAAK